MAAAVTGEVSEIPPLPPIEGGLVHLSGGLAGHVFPQGSVVHGAHRGRFDDVVGAGWRLVTVDDAPIELGPEVASWFDGIGGAVVPVGPGADVEDVDGTYARWFGQHGVTWALQRPDFQVYGSAGSGTEAADLITHLREQLATGPGAA
jgi:hypothetical protein